MLDKARKGRAKNGGYRPIGEKNGRAKLIKSQIREIRFLSQKGYTQVELAKKYGLCHTTVGRIVNYKLWQNI